MTREQWLHIEELHWIAARKTAPTANMRRLQKRVRKAVIATYGPCPKGEAKPPLKVRLGLWWLNRKIKDKETPMLLKKLLTTAVAGFGAGWAAYTAAASGGVTQDEWGAVLGAGAVAAYAAFKSNTTWLMPSRKGESVTKFGPK